MGLAGLFLLVGYAIPSLEDLSLTRDTHPVSEIILGIAVIWALTLSALYMAFRFLRAEPKTKQEDYQD